MVGREAKAKSVNGFGRRKTSDDSPCEMKTKFIICFRKHCGDCTQNNSN